MSVIKRSDLIEDSAVQWPKVYAKDLEKIIAKAKALGDPFKEGGGKAKKSLSELEKVQRQLNLSVERSDPLYRKAKAELNSYNQETREAVKLKQKETTAYDRLSIELNNSRKAYKGLAAEGKANTKAAKAQLSQIQKLDKRLKSIDNTAGQSFRTIGGYSQAIKRVTAMFLGWAAVATALWRALKSGFTVLREFNKQMIAVRKTTNLSANEMKLFRADVIAMGRALDGISIQGLLETAEIAGQLGVKGRDNILKFSKVIQQLKLTSDILGEEGARSFAKFIEISTDSVENADKLGSVITELGNNFATSESQILKNTIEIQKGIAIYDANAAAVIGLGAATNALGSEAEQARSALQTTFKVLNEGASSGKNLDKILKLTGQTAAEFREEFGKDSVKTFERFIKGLSESTEAGSNLSNTLGDLGLNQKRTEAVIGVLSKNYNVLEDSLRRANAEYINNSALTTEAGLSAESLDSKIGDVTDAWAGFILELDTGDSVITNAAIAIIDTLAGAINFLSDTMSGADHRLETFAENIKDLTVKEKADEFKSLSGEVVKYVKLQEKLNISEEEFIKLSANERSEIRLGRKNREGLQEHLDFLLAKMKLLAPEQKKVITTVIELTDAEKELIEQIKERKRLAALVTDIQKRSTDQTKAELLKEVEAQRDQAGTIISIEEKLKADLKAINGKAIEDQKLIDEKEIEDAQIIADKKREILDNSFKLGSEIANRFTDLRIEKIQSELTALEFARNRELEIAGDNEQQKNEINKRFDNERRALQKKQAIAEKANAVFQIGLNIASGIASALKTPILIPFIAALGAVQLAAVIATPIPEFDEGTESTPRDYMAGEKRPELRKSKGKWSLVDKPTLFKGSKGDKIVSGKETDSILGNISDIAGHDILTEKSMILSLLNNDFNLEKKSADSSYRLQKSIDNLTNVVRRKREVHVNVNTSRAEIKERAGNTYISRIDKYYYR